MGASFSSVVENFELAGVILELTVALRLLAEAGQRAALAALVDHRPEVDRAFPHLGPNEAATITVGYLARFDDGA